MTVRTFKVKQVTVVGILAVQPRADDLRAECCGLVSLLIDDLRDESQAFTLEGDFQKSFLHEADLHACLHVDQLETEGATVACFNSDSHLFAFSMSSFGLATLSLPENFGTKPMAPGRVLSSCHAVSSGVSSSGRIRASTRTAQSR